MKRIFDFALAAFGLIIFSPMALFFALAIKFEDGGPIFYHQDRWGRRGKKFTAYKFRTMVPDADKKWGFSPAQENDIRVTKIGKLARATAMDELPQLFNIWRGDMSFVGPRALCVSEVDPGFPHFEERHEVRPGLTGPAQVHAPRDASLEEKFRYDLDYVASQNVWKDLQLLFLSLAITLRGRWESREKKI